MVRAIRSSRWFGLLGGGRQPCLQARSEVRIIQKEPLQIQIRVNLLKKPPPIPPVYSSRDWVSAGNHTQMEEELRVAVVRRLEALKTHKVPSGISRAEPVSQPTQQVPSSEPPQSGAVPSSSTSPSPTRQQEGLLIKGLKATKQIGHGGRGQGTWTLTGTIVNRSGRAASQATLLAVFLDQGEAEVHRDQQEFPLSEAAQESAFAWKVNAVPASAEKVKVRVFGATRAGGGGR